ncbi:hypothetical protein PLESTB_001371300 [Pleodorina starrii]|uniref:Nuclear pore complex protein Nup155 n=1 Tax=Pleodorina starrii TaxID=330485 RepID=A0A9W6BUL5_9CHLO|nr:hypothetical protein PLESTM_000413800 [Pleodorina starrii]GLC58532.1 hypothetical protein PLESTB_001371300 [Pleodorina starrii]GLC74184.1 hypothetical protein PLESTF_001471100 [Pleodorina starrii]
MAAAPAWQRDVAAEGARGGAVQPESLIVPTRKFQDVDQLSKTFGHVAEVSKEFRRDAELNDLLASTSKEDTYQQHFQGWPSLLRPLSPAVLELPTMVQDKYHSCQAMCFCGLFPQIRRAWASIDDSLFLWRYDRSSDVPLEYSGEDQAITCVGLAVPRPGVFLPAIRYIIVLCTTAEVVLLGVCPSRRGGGGGGGDDSEDVPEDILLQPLPLYSIPTDNVVMTCCTAGPCGRIFLGGADGHVYELSYHAADTWRHKRISKVRLTSGLQQYLPSFVPSLLGLGAPAPIERLAVDRERHILYALNVASGIQVFDLGACGNEPARRVAEVSNVYAAAAAAPGGRELFRGATADRKAAAVKHIAPVATSESSKIHLMAVTADGRRIYFTTHHPQSYGSYNGYGGGGHAGSASAERAMAAAAAGGGAAGAAAGAGGGGTAASAEPPFPRRPDTLLAVLARAALPHSGVARGATADLSRSAALEIVAAHYSAGCLLLSEAAGGAGGGGGQGGSGATKLLAASRNTTVPPSTLNTHTGSGYGAYGYGSYGGFVAGGLRESVTELDNFVPGETCAVEATPCRPVLGADALPARAGPGSDELVSAVWWPPPRFALIGTAGVVELEKRRPVELLMQILERNSQEQLRSFFQAYGSVEAAAMCYLIATSGPPGALSGLLSGGSLGGRGSFASIGSVMPGCAPSSSSLGGGGVSALAARAAAAALDNPLLVGEARMPEDAAPAEGAYPHVGPNAANMGGGNGNGMYMGRAVDPNPGPSWSAGHRGLCLYVSRLLAPVYDKKVAVASGGKGPGGGGAASGAAAGRVLSCRFSNQTLEALEDRLQALAAFLETSIARRQQKGYAARTAAAATSVPYGGGGAGGAGGLQPPLFGGAAPGGGGGPFGYGGVNGAMGGADDPTVLIHKRRRLEHAAQQEDEMAQRIRALVLRAAEACSLLRLLSAHNLGRLALRQLGSGAVDVAKLANLTLRGLVQEAEGEAMAARLISGLVNEQLDTGMAGSGAAGTGAAALVAASGVGLAASGAANAEAMAAALQAAAPSYFRQEDRTYYQASALLKAAEAAQPGPEREATVKQAVAMLVRVPLVVHLESLTSQLANLKYYEGIVTVALAAAAARDPESLALRPELGPACELARQRRREAYGHVLGALRALIMVDGGGGGAGGGGGGAAALSAAERTAFKSALLKTALASSDTFFLDELYGFLIGSCGAADELLSRDAPGLEGYLAREGGLVPPNRSVEPAAAATATATAAAAALSGGVPIGPLSGAQVALLELLCRMLVGKGRFLDAALVHGALGCRRAGPGPDLAVPLRARVAALQSAVLHARSAGDSALVARLDSDARVVGFQASIAERLQARRSSLAAAGGGRADVGGAAAAAGDSSAAANPATALADLDRGLGELSGAPLELSVLYNTYAQPYGMWDICLQMIRFAGGGGGGGAAEPSAVVRTLWDHELLRAYDQRRDAGPAARLADACDAVSALGPSLYPDELTLPLVHVAWRLESLAAGLWPATAAAGDGGAAAAPSAAAAERASEVIVPALMTAAGGSAAAVRRVYEALLSRGRGSLLAVGGGGGSAIEAQLSSARVRVQLLRSAAAACSAALSDLQSAAPAGPGGAMAAAMLAVGPAPGVGAAREAGSLADAADRFALEARRIGGPDCEDVARRLDAVRVQAEAMR